MRHLPVLLICAAHAALAQPPASAPPAPVVASGTVPDEATKAALLQRLRGVYGVDMVIDQVAIGNVALPPNWQSHLQKLLNPGLKLITRGELKVEGNRVSVRGEVANEMLRQQLASDIAANLNPTYTVHNGLRVAAAEQALLDTTLASRIVEFDSGQATLRPGGMAILDEMAAALRKMNGKRVEVIGHTDNIGQRPANVALSLARAEAVRGYLAARGIAPASIMVSGEGPDRPVADNASAEGRARNRRIEFRVAG